MATEAAIVEWVNSFGNLTKKAKDFQDLEDGIIIHDILKFADEEYFESLILQDDKSNPILRATNLKKLWRQVSEYLESIHVTLDPTPSFEPKLVVQDHDSQELRKLIELSLGALVKCESAQEQLQRIMKLPTTTQHVLMALIQSFLSKTVEEPSSVNLDDSAGEFAAREKEYQSRLSKLEAHLAEAKQEKAHLTQLYDKAHKKTDLITRERDELKVLNDKTKREVDALQEKLKVAQKEEKKTLAHSVQLQEFVEETERLRSEKSNLSAKLEEEKKDSVKKIRHLQDENDALKDQLSNEQQERGRLEKLSKKLADYQELQNQNKALKSQESHHLQQIAQLQTEADKVKPMSNRIQQYKMEVVEKDMKITQLEASLSAKEEKITKMNEQLQQRVSDYEALLDRFKMVEKEGREEQLSTSRPTPAAASATSSAYRDGDDSVDNVLTFTEALTPEIKTKLARLEKENEELRKCSDAFSKLEDAELRNKLFEEQIRDLNKKLEDLRDIPLPASSSLKSAASSSSSEKEQELEAKLKAAQSQIQSLTIEKNKLSSVMITTKQLLEKMKDDKQTSSPKENSSIQQAHTNELTALKHQLIEKDKQIELQQRRHQEGKEAAEREVKLVKSAFYELAFDFQRLKMSKATVSSTPTGGNTTDPAGGAGTVSGGAGRGGTYLGKMRDQVNLIK